MPNDNDAMSDELQLYNDINQLNHFYIVILIRE